MRMSSRKTVNLAKALRRSLSPAKAILWRHLRANGTGFKFRKQHAAGPYVLDFYCAAAGLCVEVDGLAHDMGDNPARDERRDAWILEQGIKTLRIPAGEIFRDVELAIRLIQEECASRSPSTGFAGPPPPQKRGRSS